MAAGIYGMKIWITEGRSRISVQRSTTASGVEDYLHSGLTLLGGPSKSRQV